MENTQERIENEDNAGESAGPVNAAELAATVEALLYASEEPLAVARIAQILGCEPAFVERAVEELSRELANDHHGVEVVAVAGKYQLRTKEAFTPYVRELFAAKPRRLSQAALETLAVIAYRQPVVKSDIEKIRGVDVAPTLKTLLERGLVRIVGHQASVGQPALYGTTEDFLKLFGLNSLAELPTLRDLKEVAEDPGEPGESAEESETPERDEQNPAESGESAAAEESASGDTPAA